MASLLDKIKKASTIKGSSVLDDSVYFRNVDETPTEVPAINVALSGSLTGGMKSGILTIAGPSRHFKSMYGLLMASAYLKRNKDSVLLFYDSEFGSPIEYFESVGIDPRRVVHTPVTDLEELKFDIMKQFEAIERGDKVFIMIDSIGSLASKKEVDDAEAGKSVGDMTRAKYLKSFYRIITPHLRIKDIPLVQIAHIYMTMDMYPKAIVSGGAGIMLASDGVWLVGRQQEKEGTELMGYNFIIRIEKSRYVREKAAIPITVKFEGGMSRYTGLLEMALAAKVVIKPSNGWYSRVDDQGEVEAKKWREKDTDCAEFMEPVLNSVAFNAWVQDSYKVSNGTVLTDVEIDGELENV